MGRIGDAFQREIGKNTGKLVSNLVFGDKHSTPYRRVGSAIKNEIQKSKQEAEQKRQEKEDLNLLDEAVLDNTDVVLQTVIPQEEKPLLELMSVWGAQLATCKWEFDTKEGEIRSQYPDAVLEKFKQCMLMMRTIAPTNPMANYYEEILQKATKRRKRAKTKELRMWLIFIGIIGLLLGVVAIAKANE